MTSDDFDDYTVTSGRHLGVMRTWIQWHCANGERVTWGSTDRLEFHRSISVFEMELLAQRIANAARGDLLEEQDRERRHAKLMEEIRSGALCLGSEDEG